MDLEQWGPNQAVPLPLTSGSTYVSHHNNICLFCTFQRGLCLIPNTICTQFPMVLRGIAAATKYMLACGVFHVSVAKLVTQAT